MRELQIMEEISTELSLVDISATEDSEGSAQIAEFKAVLSFCYEMLTRTEIIAQMTINRHQNQKIEVVQMFEKTESQILDVLFRFLTKKSPEEAGVSDVRNQVIHGILSHAKIRGITGLEMERRTGIKSQNFSRMKKGEWSPTLDSILKMYFSCMQ